MIINPCDFTPSNTERQDEKIQNPAAKRVKKYKQCNTASILPEHLAPKSCPEPTPGSLWKDKVLLQFPHRRLTCQDFLYTRIIEQRFVEETSLLCACKHFWLAFWFAEHQLMQHGEEIDFPNCAPRRCEFVLA